ncbi:MAG: histidine--tRNA ligase [Candidatus Falkowbacteria bacterium]|nr:histidine--tRNA ligase [Candidatus Falkowbacteria bacterium]
MITPKRPSGFNEFLPADQMAFNAMISAIRLAYEKHGYSPIETPALELASVLLAKEGGETAKQVYRFNKGDNDLAMRFDLTIPLARYVAEHYHELAMPFRRYQIQEVWRAEKAQAGRFRQFYQCDIDIIGSNDTLADADVLLTAHEAFINLGLTDTIFNISHRGLLGGFLANKKLSSFTSAVLRAIDKLNKKPAKAVEEELIEAGLKQNDIKEIFEFVNINGEAKKVLEKLDSLAIKHTDFEKALADLKELNQYLLTSGLKAKDFVLDLKIARGLDYYTGVVFETTLSKNPEIGSVGGGGRYDNLVSHYSKENLSGVGISIGISRLFSAIKDRLSTGSASPAKALIIPFSKEVANYCLNVAATLNQANINAFVYPAFAKAGKQLSYVDKLKIPLAILIGEDEVKKKSITIKNMKSGKQITIPLSKATATVKKMI